ncbi:flagellin [Roseococcus sp. YIM B11640]|uniref:flagellin N-terminal helical domain-containing protein n=1 Tax=Roseococcus sp. YIM B11640 TaxID=3133973 RepID=UPI003C7E42E5
MSGVGLLGRLASETAVLRQRLDLLTRQQASGLRAERLGDLGAAVSRLVSMRGEVQRREVYNASMTQALGRTGVMQEALTRMTEIAREFRTTVTQRITSSDTNSLATVQSQARAALTEVAHLLNTQYTGEFLFGGSDLTHPPIPDPDGIGGGQMAQDIAAAVATLGGSGAAAVSAATLGIAQSTAAGISPFSAFLNADESLPAASQEARRAVPSDDGATIGYGIMANRNATAISTGDTTGGWARDLMRGLMSLAALDPSQMADGVQFDALVKNIRDGLLSAENALGEEAGALGQVEARMEAFQTRHKNLLTVLAGQIANIQEVDPAETLSRLQNTKATLEASYSVIGSLNGLNLVNYLK